MAASGPDHNQWAFRVTARPEVGSIATRILDDSSAILCVDIRCEDWRRSEGDFAVMHVVYATVRDRQLGFLRLTIKDWGLIIESGRREALIKE